MTAFAIGIDTGGTYTDAVIIDLASRRVLAQGEGADHARRPRRSAWPRRSARVLAASGDAARIAACTAHVALSTTLATNAIVEGHGAAIGVILIGFDARMAERTGIARAIPDAHGAARRRRPRPRRQRGRAARRSRGRATSCAPPRDRVAAYAVAAQYSVRNPTHELRVRELVAEITGRPATHLLGARAGAGRAAAGADGGAERAHHRPHRRADRARCAAAWRATASPRRC